MAELAEATGGRMFFPDAVGDYPSVYAQVAQELKQQYLLTYVPVAGAAATPRFKKIEIRYSEKSARLVYRQGYY
jgi:hypothetical protein